MKSKGFDCILLAAAGLLASCAPSVAGIMHASEPQAEGSADAELATTPDLPGTGNFPAMREVPSGLPDHIVYRPRNLEALGDRPLGVVLWGNGGCYDDAASARLHLLEIASHGYVAIAPGKAYSGPGAITAPPRVPHRPGEKFPPVKTMPSDLIAGLDWILGENERAGSPFEGLINSNMIAVAGHSCGGLQAIAVSADPRIATTIVHNSGVLDPDAFNPINGFSVAKAELRAMHGPVLYILGGESDIAYPNGMDDFERIGHVPVAVANLDVGHGGTFQQPYGGRAAAVAVNWLEWQLRGDEAASLWFVGENCRLCQDADWTYAAKGF